MGCGRAERERMARRGRCRSEEHTSELQSRLHLVCRLLLEKKTRQASSAGGVRTAPRNIGVIVLTSRLLHLAGLPVGAGAPCLVCHAFLSPLDRRLSLSSVSEDSSYRHHMNREER